jgi:hypothetical protein
MFDFGLCKSGPVVALALALGQYQRPFSDMAMPTCPTGILQVPLLAWSCNDINPVIIEAVVFHPDNQHDHIGVKLGRQATVLAHAVFFGRDWKMKLFKTSKTDYEMFLRKELST